MIMKYNFLDIETGPLPQAERDRFRPEFEAPKNLKDPEKIKAALIEKENDWNESAALSALTGQVLCAGWLDESGFRLLRGDSEKQTLEAIWVATTDAIHRGESVVGFCCLSFDWPFTIRRSYAHGIPVPRIIRHGRYFSDQLIDLAETWACAGRDPRDKVSLDTLAKFLGVGAKTGNGADFARLWAENVEQAVAYLRNDLQLTQLCHERMQ